MPVVAMETELCHKKIRHSYHEWTGGQALLAQRGA